MSDRSSESAVSVQAIQERLGKIEQRIAETLPFLAKVDRLAPQLVGILSAPETGSVRRAMIDLATSLRTAMSELRLSNESIAWLLEDRARIEAERDAWQAFAEHVAHCVECGEMSYETCHDGSTLFAAASAPSAQPEEGKEP